MRPHPGPCALLVVGFDHVARGGWSNGEAGIRCGPCRDPCGVAGQKVFSTDNGGCTQNTQIATVDNTLDLQTRLAEIEQQSELQASRLDIIDALHPTPGTSARRHVRVVQCFDHFNSTTSTYPTNRSAKYADHHVIIVHFDATLLHDRKARGDHGGDIRRFRDQTWHPRGILGTCGQSRRACWTAYAHEASYCPSNQVNPHRWPRQGRLARAAPRS